MPHPHPLSPNRLAQTEALVATTEEGNDEILNRLGQLENTLPRSGDTSQREVEPNANSNSPNLIIS